MRWFLNRSIRTQILSGFAVILLFSLGIGVSGIKSIRTIDAASSEMYERQTIPLDQLANIAESFQRVRLNLSQLILATTEGDREDNIERIEKYTATIDELSVEFEKTIRTDRMKEAYAEFLQEFDAYDVPRQKIIDLTRAGEDFEALEIFRTTGRAKALSTVNAIEKLQDLKLRSASEKEVANNELAEAATNITLIALVVAILFALGIGIFIAQGIARPVNQLGSTAQRIADGDLTARTDLQLKNELGKLATIFNTMAANTEEALHTAEEQGKRAQEALEQAQETQELVEVEQRYLNESVEHILDKMRHFAEGNLTVSVHTDRSEGPIPELFDGFNRSVSTMRDLMARVREAVETAASSANEISMTSAQLADASQTQTQQAHEVAAAVEEMVQTIAETSRNATQTATAAEQSGTSANEGGSIVMETVQKIQQIADVVTDSAATVERLGDSSRQIGEIVEVINDIADQTNLLALNAAIEAARAGDAGKGFAVVADEVRKLAERTSGATRQIAEMITSIQTETGSAVEAMQRGRTEVDAGIKLADNAGQALQRIVQSTEQTKGMVMQIAAASEEQSTTSEQIARSIEHISSMTNESASGVSVISTTAMTLDQLTGDLRDLIDEFTLKSHSVHA